MKLPQNAQIVGVCAGCGAPVFVVADVRSFIHDEIEIIVSYAAHDLPCGKPCDAVPTDQQHTSAVLRTHVFPALS